MKKRTNNQKIRVNDIRKKYNEKFDIIKNMEKIASYYFEDKKDILKTIQTHYHTKPKKIDTKDYFIYI